MKKRSMIKKPKAIKTKKRTAEAKTRTNAKTAKKRTSSTAKGKKKRTGKKMRILAVAAVEIGKTTDHHINSMADVDATFVRPYINGLIDGLLAENLSADPNNLHHPTLGQDYDIWYRHILHSADNGSFAPGNEKIKKPNDLIFAMSGQVVDLALTNNNPPVSTPIVFPSVSFPNNYSWGNPLPDNVAGINAQRSQTAGACFTDFLQTVPALQSGVVGYLSCPDYLPSDVAEQSVKSALKSFPNAQLYPIPVTDKKDLITQLAALPTPPPYDGLLVLPVDFCFAAAGDIINTVQNTYKRPTFFPIPDWVQPTLPPPALGAYGVSQYECGYLAAHIVFQILWKGASPSAFGVQPAPPNSFDWLVSQSAANALNIQLNVQNIAQSGGTIVP